MTVQNEEEMLDKARLVLDHVAAGGTLGKLVNLTEQDLEAMYTVGYNQFAAHKYGKAMDIFKFLCLYDHTEPRWYYSLGVAQQSNGDYADAVNSFAMATILDVEDPRPQAQAGYCLMALGRWPEAVSALEGAIIACGEAALHRDVKSQAAALLENARTKAAASKGAEK